MEALSSSETSVLTRATRRNIPEDAILHSHLRENLKSYMGLVYLDWIGLARDRYSWRSLLNVVMNLRVL
jgi:hypothetical protein